MTTNKHGVLEMGEIKYDANRPAAEQPIKIQDVTFRDGHQSLFATRGRTEDMIHVAEDMDHIGFYSMEIWGGATFDAMHRYLGEDPWERLRTLKDHLKRTPVSMLLRGQNLIGYRNYADDLVCSFVQKSCDHGVDIFRVFDALNDYRNIETAAAVIKRNNKHFQGTICYSMTEMRMGGEVYTIDYFLNKARALETMGADSICIKDMAGLLAPYDAYNLVRGLKGATKVPIHLHTHCTSGMGDLTLLKAIEAGVDIIDTCMAPYAYRTSHPAIEPLVIALLGTNRDTGLDVHRLVKINKKLEDVIPKYLEYADRTKFSIIDPNVIIHQTPGGMLSNLVNQLKQMDALDRLDEVLEELPKVRRDLGQVPLVTPTSQIVGTQTVNNVLFDQVGNHYEKITEQVKDLCFGLYGQTTKPVDEVVQRKALKGYERGETPIDKRPGDIIEEELAKAAQEFSDVAKTEEDVLLCALYPVTGRRFLKWKYGEEPMPAEMKPKKAGEVQRERGSSEKKSVPEKPAHARSFDVFVDDDYFKVFVADSKSVSAKPSAKKVSSREEAKVEGGNELCAHIPGMVVEYKKGVGDPVKEGETVVILESMKMYNNHQATRDGIVKKITHAAGDSVEKGDVLAVIE